ncbi:TRAP transporter small permease [Desulfohalobium retbaense]|jgi:TRAP-type C4-dicarboxylate transport system permease small subunit|uniref:Tripartite ATP-independent periplasmic transporters, DctQ component, putative n=1 Tax=Desulfohalobium retbaense (strain ATCC 49708 / DSM 5692 / JCM 16813 / HR100) TaxID=485915 RepID=C8X5P2_DESRD|nr:TRAP transporter small permease [Desulfohalobium retbaense]ACV69739.1 tripartite ATP-independent periplasmic transporters, DctQ component, putative [Desulfohalobium retbaense DSM 5692]
MNGSLLNRISSALMVIAGGALLLMVGIGCANILGRAVGIPLKGTYELMGYFGAVAGSLALAITQIEKGHIRIGFLARWLPRRLSGLLDRLGLFCSAMLFGAISWQCGLLAFSLWHSGQVSETLRLNYAIFPLAVSLGTACLALVLLFETAILREQR